MSETPDSVLVLPAIRAAMGDWVYYLGAMRLSDICSRVSAAQDIHTSTSLRDLLQRQLTERSTYIADYLIRHEQRFFNSLVLGSYGGAPKWHEVSIREIPSSFGQELPLHLEGTLGFLVLDGTEKLFAIDGQHRIAGIREAIGRSEALKSEEIGVILVAGVSQEYRGLDAAGFERTRRLFTTLNRYAKPVSKSDIIALDEDDVVAITTRKIVEDFPLFEERIATGPATSINHADQKNFTNIGTIYDSLDVVLRRGSQKSWRDYKKIRPPEEDVEAFGEQATELWDAYAEHFPELQELKKSAGKGGEISAYRNASGGHLSFRPVGLMATVRAARALLESEEISIGEALQRISTLPMTLGEGVWVGVLWDATNRRMITAREHQNVAKKLLLHFAGGDLKYFRTNASRVHKELAGILNKEEREIDWEGLMAH